jgi:hypothetical protein
LTRSAGAAAPAPGRARRAQGRAYNRPVTGNRARAMKKAIDIVLKVLLSLILVLPILGLLGVGPPASPDLYNTPQAWDFIEMLNEVRYISIIMAVVHVVALVCLWARRTAIAALLILPITVNVVGFHAFLDGGLLKPGAIPGNVMLLLNLYFLWKHRGEYRPLLNPTS